GLTLDLLQHLVVPAAALALPLAAMFERLQAQAMSETVSQPFVLATIARGVPRRRVIWRDALKAALRPIAAVYGLVVGTLLSGSFVVEVITAWPGLEHQPPEARPCGDHFDDARSAQQRAGHHTVAPRLSCHGLACAGPR